MALQPTHAGQPPVDPQPRDTDRVRDAIAVRAQRMDTRFPRACDLEAAALVAMAGELRGVASQLSGVHCPEHFREMLRGERTMPLGDVCRLAVEPAAEAKAAVRAGLTVIETALSSRATVGTLATSAARTANAATELLGQLARAQEDGVIDADEKATLRRTLTQLLNASDAIKALLYSDEGRG